MKSSRKYIGCICLGILAVMAAGVFASGMLSAVYPPDNAVDVPPGNIVLAWEPLVPFGRNYRFSFGETASELKNFKPATSPSAADVMTYPGKTYIWQVKADLISSDQTTLLSSDITSDVHRFTTAAAQVVDGPLPVFPTDKSVDTPYGEITLQWKVLLKDQKGQTYDATAFMSHFKVNFGHNAETLKLYRGHLTKPVCDVVVGDDRKYLWQVEAVDEDGSKLISPVWSFTTASSKSGSGGCSVTQASEALLLIAPIFLLMLKR